MLAATLTPKPTPLPQPPNPTPTPNPGMLAATGARLDLLSAVGPMAGGVWEDGNGTLGGEGQCDAAFLALALALTLALTLVLTLTLTLALTPTLTLTLALTLTRCDAAFSQPIHCLDSKLAEQSRVSRRSP